MSTSRGRLPLETKAPKRSRRARGGGKREKRKRCTDIRVYLVSVDAEVTLLCTYKAAEIRGVFGARGETIARERERADGAGRK